VSQLRISTAGSGIGSFQAELRSYSSKSEMTLLSTLAFSESKSPPPSGGMADDGARVTRNWK